MSRFRRFEIVERSPSPLSYFLKEERTSIFSPPPSLMLQNPFCFPIVEDDFELDHLDLLTLANPLAPRPPILFDDEFDTITDLIQIDDTPFHTSTRRITRRSSSGLGRELYLHALSDRVAALESGFDRLVKEEKKKKKAIGERKYTWTAEIKSPEKDDRKYKLVAEIKDDKKKGVEKNYKWTAEIKRKDGDERTYTYKVSSGGDGKSEKKNDEKVKDKKKKSTCVGPAPRIVEIEGPSDHGAVVLKQVFAKRVQKIKGKKKELSPQDAATLIQLSFRAYLIRRSQALRALRELAIAKTKLKEIRALFNNFTYRRRLARDAAERQTFSEKIIVLLLTVDAIEGADLMVRAAKKSMVDELEAMLDVVDPQPGKSLSMRRRTFDMPDGTTNKELAQMVQSIVEDANANETFEACL